jgi:predicted DCC family thiol-disulfide oxidoreductase YuxK
VAQRPPQLAAGRYRPRRAGKKTPFRAAARADTRSSFVAIDGLGAVPKVWNMAEVSDVDFDVEVFFDGDCPLCMREVELLRKLDEKNRRIRFTDIQGAGFSAESLGLTFADVMRRIHGRLPTGELIEGPEVFRRLYTAVGFKRAVAVSRWPGFSQLVDAGYALFAKNRLRLTGRCTDEVCNMPSRRLTPDGAPATSSPPPPQRA